MKLPSQKIRDCVDHIEMEHEREVAPGTTWEQIDGMHNDMHRLDPDGEQYGHTHPNGGFRRMKETR